MGTKRSRFLNSDRSVTIGVDIVRSAIPSVPPWKRIGGVCISCVYGAVTVDADILKGPDIRLNRCETLRWARGIFSGEGDCRPVVMTALFQAAA